MDRIHVNPAVVRLLSGSLLVAGRAALWAVWQVSFDFSSSYNIWKATRPGGRARDHGYVYTKYTEKLSSRHGAPHLSGDQQTPRCEGSSSAKDDHRIRKKEPRTIGGNLRLIGTRFLLGDCQSGFVSLAGCN
jgi:hypothetical protein